MKVFAAILLLLAALPGTAPAGPSSDAPSPDILVYYFHNEFRCQTCLTMESEAEAVVLDDFADDIESGLLAWRTVNLQEPGHEHFAARYSLDGPSLVIVEQDQNREMRWKHLDRTWELVDSPTAYREYVRAELAAFLSGASTDGEQR